MIVGTAGIAAILANVLAIAPAALLVLLLVTRRRPARILGAAFLSYAWMFALQTVVNSIADGLGLWHYKIDPAFLGTPLTIGLGLACLFGPLAFLLFPAARLAHIILSAVAIDAAILAWTAEASAAGAIVRAIVLCGGVATAQSLARVTAQQQSVRWRAAVQGITWLLLIFWQFPSAVFAQTGGAWTSAAMVPAYLALSLGFALLLLLLAGLNAVQGFSLRGDGTPFPFDPPKRLVVSGAYAYVRNPMQIAICGGLLVLGGLFAQPWIAFGAIEAVILFVAFRHVCAGTSTVKRDDPLAPAYHAGVPAWLPRWYPWHPSLDAGIPIDRLDGPPRSRLMQWFGRQQLQGLVPHAHAVDGWEFRSGDGRYRAHGLVAIGQALQHINLAWAALGWLLCLLPVSRHVTDHDPASAPPREAVTQPR